MKSVQRVERVLLGAIGAILRAEILENLRQDFECLPHRSFEMVFLAPCLRCRTSAAMPLLSGRAAAAAMSLMSRSMIVVAVAAVFVSPLKAIP
jgi:hypothetical protein